jgi:tetratricopeptide (TPR) repeat protein
MKKALLSLIILFLASTASFAQKQTKKEQAEELKKNAIEKMDKGELDESIKLLEQAKKLDKKNSTYDYEIAYATYRKKDYKTAISIAEKILKAEDAEPEYYRLLGNSYDMTGNPDKAIEMYMEGIKMFPKSSGKFYAEAGTVEYGREKYDEAIAFWEKGIKADPYYASNYYRLANIFSMTDENIWTLLYGEMFMNLEMNTSRTEEISKLLYDTYKKTFIAKSETEGDFFLTKNTTVYVNPEDDPATAAGLLNFELTYLTAYATGGGFLEGVDIKSVYETKKQLLSFWADKKFDKPYANKLIDFEQKMISDNVYEAYVYWLLSVGNPNEFDSWYSQNKNKFNSLVAWVKENKIDLKPEYKYARTDYLQH